MEKLFCKAKTASARFFWYIASSVELDVTIGEEREHAAARHEKIYNEEARQL